MRAGNYTMVLPVRHFRVDQRRVAVESAFAEHLRMMRSRIGASGRLVVASPAMTAARYGSIRHGLSTIDEDAEAISFHTLFSDDAMRSRAGQIRACLPALRSLHRLAKESYCVHSGLSWNVFLPFEFASIVSGVRLKRRTVFVVDIDYRNSARMSYRSGDWSRASYLVCKYVYDAARSLQVRYAARHCSVVLLKGRQMARDFGKGRANVKDFLDASHGEKNVIDASALEEKLRGIQDESAPLRLAYFGRLTAYKGVDRCLRAVSLARRAGANVTLDIIGDGEQMEALRSLARELGAEAFVTFHGVLPFDQAFFHRLYRLHVLLAAPLREDTPRSALDAMAAGIPYVAFDTYYYRELLDSGAGRVVPWPEVEAMAREIAALAGNRAEVARMARNAVVYARHNTQEIWLEKRLAWTLGQDSGRGASASR